MPSATIVGAGIAGLASAIALRRAGYDVRIVEQADALGPVGAAISLWPNAVAGLRILGAADPIERNAAPIETMLLADQTGRTIMLYAVSGTPGAFLPTRSMMQSALVAALGDVEMLPGHRVIDISQRVGVAVATLADGRVLPGDLVVVADGIWSATATRIIGNAPRYCGYGGALAMVSTGEPPNYAATEFWGAGERFGLFTAAGGLCYWFYMANRAADAPALTISEISDRARGWPEPIVRTVVATPSAALLPIAVHARPAPRRLGSGRIVCVGDAAHAMEPNLGQGACQGIEDAIALGVAAVEAASPTAVLRAFERMRLRRVRSFVRRSSEGRFGAHGAASTRALWRTLLHVMPERVHRQIIEPMHHLPDYR